MSFLFLYFPLISWHNSKQNTLKLNSIRTKHVKNMKVLKSIWGWQAYPGSNLYILCTVHMGFLELYKLFKKKGFFPKNVLNKETLINTTIITLHFRLLALVLFSLCTLLDYQVSVTKLVIMQRTISEITYKSLAVYQNFNSPELWQLLWTRQQWRTVLLAAEL